MCLRHASRTWSTSLTRIWMPGLALAILAWPFACALAEEAAKAPAAEKPAAEKPAAETPAAETPAPEAEIPETTEPTTLTAEEAAATGVGAAGLPVALAPAELQNDWRLMVHYFKLARFDVAKQLGEKILKAAPDGKTVLALTESPSTGYDLVVRMLTVEEMGEVPAKLLSLADEGARLRQTDAARIVKNLQRLGEGPRAYFLAMKELKYSGPYAVPYALAILQNPAEAELAPFVVRALMELGRPVVLPLERALATPNQKLKETIVGVLGQIGYPYSLPTLKALIEDPKSTDGIKAAAAAAIRKFADENVLKTPAKLLYLDLAERYYYDRILVADLRKPTTDVFDWVDGTGLIYRAAPSKAVNEILAARACADCLAADPGALEAVALWVSAMMQMEAELGGQAAREANPFLPPKMPSVDFFARAVGQQHLYKVLDRALADRNSAVAVRACEALQDVANESFLALYGQGDVGSPLVMALTYPDQRVRFAAAFALANIRPKNPFTGAGKVVPTLGEALNLEAGKTILLAEPEANNRNRLAAALKEGGWEVAAATSGNQALSTARALPRIDAIVLSSRTKDVDHAKVVEGLRMDYQTAMTPIIVLSYPDDPVKASWLEEKTRFLKAVDPAVEPEALLAQIDAQKKKAGSLVLDAAAARGASLRAAKVLKEIAASSRIYSATRARQALLEGLGKRPDELVVAVLAALAEIPDAEITQAMADVAIDAARSKDVRVAALQALARSARTVGNKLKADQLAALQGLAAEPDDAIRNAAGEALGGLDLDAAEGAKIILAAETAVPAAGAAEPAKEAAPEKPAEEKPAAEKPAAEKPPAEKPPAEKPAAAKPPAEKPAAEKPAAEKPAAAKPAAEK